MLTLDASILPQKSIVTLSHSPSYSFRLVVRRAVDYVRRVIPAWWLLSDTAPVCACL